MNDTRRNWFYIIIQIEHGVEGSGKNYWSRGVSWCWIRETTSRREAEGSSLTHVTPRDQEFSLLLDINHVVFVLLYLINILLIN